jgi:hypothetical protein
MDPPPSGPTPIRPLHLPATYGCMVVVFLVLLVLALADLLQRAGLW